MVEAEETIRKECEREDEDGCDVLEQELLIRAGEKKGSDGWLRIRSIQERK